MGRAAGSQSQDHSILNIFDRLFSSPLFQFFKIVFQRIAKIKNVKTLKTIPTRLIVLTRTDCQDKR